MWRPVMVKNVPPNIASPQGFAFSVIPSPMSVIHSLACRIMNSAPPAIVARIQGTTFARFPWREWWTARTIVKLLLRRQNVIRDEKAMDGHMWNGAGHLGLDIRR